MIEFYDVHAHQLDKQTGGILINLEHPPKFRAANKELSGFYIADYINKEFQNTSAKIIKYHPRREKYSVNQVIEDLNRRNVNICIIDTLNLPFWQPSDYWKIASQFSNLQFIFPHAGGYDIIEFIKICNFQKNVWLDFSMTQEYFGWCGERESLKYVCETIDYALNSDMINSKVLFGSDNPFFSQETALNKYLKHKNSRMFLKNNFERLLEGANL